MTNHAPDPTTLRSSTRPPPAAHLPPVPALQPTMSATPAVSAPSAGPNAPAAAPPLPIKKPESADDEDGAETGVMKRDQHPDLAAVIAKVVDTTIKNEAGVTVEMKVERYKGPEPLNRAIMVFALLGMILAISSRFVAGKIGYGVFVGVALVIIAVIRLLPRLLLLEKSFEGVLEVANEAKLEAAEARYTLDKERVIAQAAAEAAVTDGKTKDAEIERLKGLLDNSVPKPVADELVRRDPTNVPKCRPTDVREINEDGTLVAVDIYAATYSSDCKVFLHLKHEGEPTVTQCWLKRGKRYSFDGLVVSIPADNGPVLVVRRNMNAAKINTCPMNKTTSIPKIGDVFVTAGPKAAASRMFSPSGASMLFGADELEEEARTTASPIALILSTLRSHGTSTDGANGSKKS